MTFPVLLSPNVTCAKNLSTACSQHLQVKYVSHFRTGYSHNFAALLKPYFSTPCFSSVRMMLMLGKNEINSLLSLNKSHHAVFQTDSFDLVALKDKATAVCF